MNLIQKTTLAVLMATSLSAFADLKVGVVNIQQVFTQVPQGQGTVQTIKTSLSPEISHLKNEQEALNTAVSDFNRNAPTMTASDRAKAEQSITTQQQQFQQDVNALKDTEMQKQQAAAQNFQRSLVKAIKEVAKEGGYNMILTDQTIPFYDPSFDVTSQVVALMSKGS